MPTINIYQQMINIFINNQCYSCPTSWDDITLQQAVALDEFTENLSKEVKDRLAAKYEPSAERDIPDTDSQTMLQIFEQKLFALLCKIPENVVQQTDPKQINRIVDQYLIHFATGMIFEPDYEPRHIQSFEWEGERLFLPKSDTDLQNIEMPLAQVSAIELCEATDLYNADRILQAAMIIAILCRPEGEQYDENKAKLRAKTMGTLPMSIALEVFFCLSQRTNI